MTSLKQSAANRLNALKSTGPRSADGKQRSRQNALAHGLTAETVVTALEHAADYQALEASLMVEHQPRSATDRELVVRLASVLWRLRRATSIETGLFQIQGAVIREQRARHSRRRTMPPPQWQDELDNVRAIDGSALAPAHSVSTGEPPPDRPEMLADCFLQVSRLGYGAFDLLSRYESALWRQAAQLLFILQSVARR